MIRAVLIGSALLAFVAFVSVLIVRGWKRSPDEIAERRADQVVFVEKDGVCFAIAEQYHGVAMVWIPCAEERAEAKEVAEKAIRLAPCAGTDLARPMSDAEMAPLLEEHAP